MTAPASEPTEAAVLAALTAVREPDLDRHLVELDFVKNLEITGGRVAFSIQLASHSPSVRAALQAAAETAVKQVPGVDSVAVTMTANVSASRPVLGDKGMIPGARNVIAVSSGKGGVGKSTVAVNLACALHRAGAKVGILDADVYGPNVPLMLGATGQPKTAGKRIIPLEAHGLQLMSMALLVEEDRPVIWRGPMLHSAMRQFLTEVDWQGLDYLVVDLPPGTGDAQLSLSQQAHLTGAIIVTTPQDVSVLDVKKAIRMFQQVQVPILGVVENMAWFTPPGQAERYHLFGEGGGQRIESEFQVPLLGQVPIEIDVREGGDRGTPVVLSHPESGAAGALIDVADRVMRRVTKLNAE
ncbi:MAG: Mrp/NBP35 family ATP-binding protein [bacterium]|nr:Mrp/NBP35 family ATP-binding protein [bacterium]